eukprot:176720_1
MTDSKRQSHMFSDEQMAAILGTDSDEDSATPKSSVKTRAKGTSENIQVDKKDRRNPKVNERSTRRVRVKDGAEKDDSSIKSGASALDDDLFGGTGLKMKHKKKKHAGSRDHSTTSSTHQRKKSDAKARKRKKKRKDLKAPSDAKSQMSATSTLSTMSAEEALKFLEMEEERAAKQSEDAVVSEGGHGKPEERTVPDSGRRKPEGKYATGEAKKPIESVTVESNRKRRDKRKSDTDKKPKSQQSSKRSTPGQSPEVSIVRAPKPEKRVSLTKPTDAVSQPKEDTVTTVPVTLKPTGDSGPTSMGGDADAATKVKEPSTEEPEELDLGFSSDESDFASDDEFLSDLGTKKSEKDEQHIPEELEKKAVKFTERTSPEKSTPKPSTPPVYVADKPKDSEAPDIGLPPKNAKTEPSSPTEHESRAENQPSR